MFTGTLIEDLIATVERVEAAQPAQPRAANAMATDAWLAVAQESTNYESKFLLWQKSGVA